MTKDNKETIVSGNSVKDKYIERAEKMLLKGEFLHDGDIYTPKDINETIERLIPLIKEACDACVEGKELQEKYVGWIGAAVCPECDGSGAYYCGGTETDPDVCQCQWCDHKKQFLQALKEPNN